MNYSLKQLRVFVAVARHGSFSRAGEAIGLTQSAVSHSVKELEAEVGVRLLDRTTREVVLTDAGLRLANRVERLLDELQAALLDARSFGVQRSGTVRVATSQTISAHLMPQCIAAGEREYPEIRIMLRDQAQQQVLHSVRNAEVDFGIVVDPVQAVDWSAKRCCMNRSCCCAATITRCCAARGALVGVKRLPPGVAGLCVGQPTADRQRAEAAGRRGAGGAGNRPSGHAVPDGGGGDWHQHLPGVGAAAAGRGRLRVRRLVPEINRALMLVRRKNRSLTPAAEAIWQVARQQAALLHQRRQENAEY